MVHRIQEAELEAAASLLSRAMARYPLFEYLAPVEQTQVRKQVREDKLRRIFRFILRVALHQGEIVAPSRDIEAIAIWTPSERLQLSMVGALRAGFFALPNKVGLRPTGRLLKLAKQKQALRRKILDSPYHLLDMLAVDPSLQRKGYGRLLLESKLEELDRVHTQCYLETSAVRNVVYYQNYGFELIHEHSIETVPVYCLRRRGR